MLAYDIPQFFLMKVPDERGAYYVVCQSIVAVAEGSMPHEVEASVTKQLQIGRIEAEVCEIPPPSDDGSTWMALASKIQVKPR